MAIGKNLLKEKTNVGVRATTTFNAPGNYKAPYGKSVVTIGGRGASGNAGNPGNPGNPNNPGSHTPGNFAPGPATYYRYMVYNYSGARFSNPRTCYGSFGGHANPYGPRTYYLFSPYTGQHAHNIITYSVDYSPNTTNPGSFTPGNPGTAGNAGGAGSAGSDATIGGIYFAAGAGGNAGNAGSIGSPGGSGGAGATGTVVSPTTTTIEYSEAGISITVPSGGYVDISNL